LREYITITPTSKGDHRTLLGSFFLFTPLQYFVVLEGVVHRVCHSDSRVTFSLRGHAHHTGGRHRKLLERTSKIHWGLMSCTYGLSHVPALLMLRIPGYEGRNAALVFYFLLSSSIE